MFFKKSKEPTRKQYVRAMLAAIDGARQSDGFMTMAVSMTFGLRVIREFERRNPRGFNPFDSGHVNRIRRMGWVEYSGWRHFDWPQKQAIIAYMMGRRINSLAPPVDPSRLPLGVRITAPSR